MADNDGGPECVRCKSTSSMMWQRNQSGAILCLDCHAQEKKTRSSRSPQRRCSATFENSNSSSSHSGNQGQVEKPSIKPTATVSTRRTTRARERNNRAKQQTQSASMNSASPSPAPSTTNSNGVGYRGLAEKSNSKPINGSHGDREDGDDYQHQQKSRRSINLKQGQPTRAPRAEAMIVTSDSIIHKGTTYEVGDVVSLLDRGGGIYYAMIRGFMQDQYAEKYAVLTWLLPRYPNPTHFDPTAFILGPEADEPRSMEVIEFVSHSPQSRHFQTSYFHNLEQAEQWKH